MQGRPIDIICSLSEVRVENWLLLIVLLFTACLVNLQSTVVFLNSVIIHYPSLI